MSHEREHRFFTVIGIAAAVIVFAGFARTYFLRPVFHLPSLPPLLHVHGALFTAWIVLFIAQVRLVAAKRIDWHRRLGIIGAVLAVLMIVVGWAIVTVTTRRNFLAGGGAEALSFMAIAGGDILLFAVFIGAGLVYRRRADRHKRFMLLATIALLPAAFARVPGIADLGSLGFFAATDLPIAVCVLVDQFLWKRVHPVYLYGGLAVVLSQPARLWLGNTDAFLGIARWLIQ